MLGELMAFSQARQDSDNTTMTNSEVAGAASALEDYVVILQKATARDPTSIISLVDSRLVEKLHFVLDKMTEFISEKENSSAACNG